MGRAKKTGKSQECTHPEQEAPLTRDQVGTLLQQSAESSKELDAQLRSVFEVDDGGAGTQLE